MIQKSSNNDRKNCEDNKLYYKNEKKLKKDRIDNDYFITRYNLDNSKKSLR